MFNKKWTLHRVHKWLGLIAASWLIILGLTGFLLDHRDTWRWLWQGGISASYINKAVVDKSHGHIKYYQINPKNSQHQVSAGLTGLWWSRNAGLGWIKTKFFGAKSTPMISAVIFSSKNKLWIATDDGLWLSDNGGLSAIKVALNGSWVSSISINNKADALTGVVERSRLFKYDINDKKLVFVAIKPVIESALPEGISLSRFTRDVHYGRGVFDIPLSLLWNDITAIAMIVLPLSGFLFYWLPKKWRREKERNRIVSHKFKKQSMRWLFRFHGPTFGLLTVIPLIYLSLTGILLDHGKELRGWMKSIEVSRRWQTPVYNLKSWQGEIYGVVSDSSNAGKLSIATRLGLFTTDDNGQHWQRERLLNNKSNFIWTLRSHNNNIFVGGMGSPNLVKIKKQPWQIVKGVGHMPSDITMDEKSNWIWKSRHGLKSGKIETGFKHKPVEFPVINYVPWFYIIDGLHSGILIHSQWKWINDFIAVLAIILVITGLIRWWRIKWI